MATHWSPQEKNRQAEGMVLCLKTLVRVILSSFSVCFFPKKLEITMALYGPFSTWESLDNVDAFEVLTGDHGPVIEGEINPLEQAFRDLVARTRVTRRQELEKA